MTLNAWVEMIPFSLVKSVFLPQNKMKYMISILETNIILTVNYNWKNFKWLTEENEIYDQNTNN